MATDPNRLAGTAFVAADGTAMSLTGELTYTLSGETTESLTGQDGYHGYSAKPTVGEISFKGRDGPDVSIDDINRIRNATVTAQLANGKTIVGRNMSRIGPPVEVSTEDASFSIKFEGPDVVEA